MSRSLKSLVVVSSLFTLLFVPVSFTALSARGADLRASTDVQAGPLSTGAGVNVGTSGVGVGIGAGQGGYYGHDNYYGQDYGHDGWRGNQGGYYAHDGHYDNYGSGNYGSGNYGSGHYAVDPGYNSGNYGGNPAYYGNQPAPYGQYYYDRDGDGRDDRYEKGGAGAYFNVR